MADQDLLNQDYGVAAPAPAAAPAPVAAKTDDNAWKTGYDTLAKQLGAIQGKADVYKRGSPLSADKHIDNIAKSLAKDYGVTNLSDIGVREIIRPGYQSGSDESATWIPDEKVPEYYNKKDPTKVIPGYKFASEGSGKGFSDYNLQPVPDGKGGTIVVPVQQYSKSGLGAFVQDLGPILPVINLTMMAAGVPPLYAGAGNLALQGAAGNINDFNDALRIAAPFAIAGGLQELAAVGGGMSGLDTGPIIPVANSQAGTALSNVLGNSITGLPADILGGGLSNAIKAGLTGGDVLSSALTGAVTPALSAGVNRVTSGLKDAYGKVAGFAPDFNPDDFSAEELTALGGGSGGDLYDPTRLQGLYDIENPGAVVTNSVVNPSITSLTTELDDLYDPNRVQSLYDIENPGASSVDPTVASMVTIDGKEYLLDNKGGASTLNADGTYTNLNATQFAALGEPDLDPDTNPLGSVRVRASTGKNDVTRDLTNNDVIDLSTLTSLTQFGPFASSQAAAITSSQAAALTTSDKTALTTSNAKALDTSTIGALTSNQIVALTGTIGTGLLLTDLTTGGDKKTGSTTTGDITTLTTSPATTLTTGATTLSTSTIPALTSSSTVLDTNQIGALTTINAMGLQGIADPANRYWRQTGAKGTGGKGGVKFFDWYDTPENRTMAPPAMTTASIPAITSEQAGAMAAPTAKQYFNESTNRYYTDPTGKWQPPAGWTQTGLKGGGEVETKHFDGGGLADYFDYASGWVDPGLDLSSLGNDFALDPNIFSDTAFNLFDSADVLSDSQVNDYLRNLPSDNASYGDIDRTAQYQSDIKTATAGEAKSVIDKLTGMGAKLTESALKSIENNPGAWLAALAGAGLGYAASQNSNVSPMGLQSLGLTQPQVYGALKGVPISRAEGGEIHGYAGGGGLHYLKSAEDGMADKIPATIDNKQPARLSGGEFVIPADVVSHLGNGNSEAGAKQLYGMMDRIRRARTGTKKQGKQINPAKFTPK